MRYRNRRYSSTRGTQNDTGYRLTEAIHYAIVGAVPDRALTTRDPSRAQVRRVTRRGELYHVQVLALALLVAPVPVLALALVLTSHDLG